MKVSSIIVAKKKMEKAFELIGSKNINSKIFTLDNKNNMMIKNKISNLNKDD